MYSIGTLFVSGIYVQIPSIKDIMMMIMMIMMMMMMMMMIIIMIIIIISIPGNHEVRELQKAAILGTAHILRKVLT
jgi:hypothetical protein